MSAIHNLAYEIKRKLIHLSAIWIPMSVYFFSYPFMQRMFIISAIVVITVDYLRLSTYSISKYIVSWINYLKLNHIFREHEHKKLTGASYMMLSAVICSYLFKKEVFIIAFSILVISDTVAAIIGKKFGKRYIFDKTIEGSIAFFLSSFAIVIVNKYLFSLNISFTMNAVVASFIATIVELVSNKVGVDDNLSIPISFGIALSSFNNLSLI